MPMIRSAHQGEYGSHTKLSSADIPARIMPATRAQVWPLIRKCRLPATPEGRLIHVNWAAFAIVAVVSIAASAIFTILLASGIRLVSAAKIKSNEGGSGTAAVSLGYLSLGIAALIVLFGIYLIVPQFH